MNYDMKHFLCYHCQAVLLAVALVYCSVLSADEGMWLPGRTDKRAMDAARRLGLRLTDDELYGEDGTSLKDCVVDFSDYCSGVIVSPDGLLFTNHHCGFRAIQRLSSTEDDILANGFVARTRAEERPVEGLFVKLWLRSEDVTARVDSALGAYLADKHVLARRGRRRQADVYAEYAGRVLDEIAREAEREAENSGLRGIVCEAKPFEGGRRYLLAFYRQYADVRLVFTVPQSLGKFGGDTDNWMWPRQTADFSVFRIYADSLGQPAEYSPDNQPLHPTRYARVSLDGYGQGSYCMTIGYPGSTSRYLSSYGIEERTGVTNVAMIEVRGVKQEVWRRWMRADRTVGIKYAAKYASSSNYWKNSQGMNEAVSRLGIVSQKQQREQDIRRWYAASADRKARYGRVLTVLCRAYADRREARRVQGFVSETFYRGIELTAFARLAARYAEAHPNYRQTLEEYAEQAYKDCDPRVDEEVMAALLENYAQQVGKKYLPRFYADIRKRYGGDYAAYVHDVFQRSRLTSYEGWYALTHATVRSSITVDDSLEQARLDEEVYRQHVGGDPAVQMANDVERMLKCTTSAALGRTAPLIAYNEDLLTQAVIEMEQEQPHYSDANFTQRMSFGIVSDYTNAGTHHDFLTTMPSLIEKIENGRDNPDYAMQADILALLKGGDYGRYAEQRSGQLPLCFLTTNDITGGNSGSPMFNAKGELIGLAFDGNWDALSSDISFDENLTRCIGVDIRFVLWLIERWGHADHLIDEILNGS